MARCLKDLNRVEEARPYLSFAQQSWGRHLAGTRIGDEIVALSSHFETNRA